ncbi:DUF4350 domain-containing protein [Pedobacter endophyticus]|uniref:DUF4350 domain-containing protein n=1 Tax=Pedobacter endophyticus TaxID=2789740 RepID=A0A7U3SPB5_9SPHI|nr:DUF4350 domain-containing protein [Pedobacter endophyticus]QPH38288.1 DUF4350 domain-containing protein [Pedobacter endophyticus]
MKGYKIYFGIGLVLIVVYLVAQYNKPTPTNWAPTYISTDKIPYGTYILHHRIKDILPGAKIEQSRLAIYNTLKNKRSNGSAYLIVAQTANISKVDFEQMKKFMRAGNSIFIASYDFGKMAEELKLRTAQTMSMERPSLNFTNEALKTEANYGFERGIGGQYFSQIDSTRAIVLGVNQQQKANFVKYPFGKGALYLIAEPGFYTNFTLLNKYGAEYAAKTLSYIQKSNELILDQYFATKKNETTDILRVFFKHPELRWAYYLSIFGLIIFVLYDIKRKQRIIPVADPLKNSSVDFVNVVGSVYYHERNNLDIALKKINYFLAFLRGRYYIKTNDIDASFAQLLIEKTGINEPSAKTLTNYFMQIPQMSDLSDHQLIGLNESIEQFYKNTQRHGAGTI